MFNFMYCRLQLKTLQRYYGQYNNNNSNIHSKHNGVNAQILLSEENRQRCLNKMKTIGSGMAHLQRVGHKRESSFAAVLIAICTDKQFGHPAILYTRRSSLLSRHRRQVSFPGGIKDDNEDFIQCALRETQEEIGLAPERITIWGTGNLLTPPYTASIMPVVGVVNNFQQNELDLNMAEVEEVFTIPIETLCDPHTLRYTQFKSGYSSPAFIVNGIRIWGITGFLTNIFLNCLLPEHLNNIKDRVKYIKPFKHGKN